MQMNVIINCEWGLVRTGDLLSLRVTGAALRSNTSLDEKSICPPWPLFPLRSFFLVPFLIARRSEIIAFDSADLVPFFHPVTQAVVWAPLSDGAHACSPNSVFLPLSAPAADQLSFSIPGSSLVYSNRIALGFIIPF